MSINLVAKQGDINNTIKMLSNDRASKSLALRYFFCRHSGQEQDTTMGDMCERDAISAQGDNDGHKSLRSAHECVHGEIVECLRGNMDI